MKKFLVKNNKVYLTAEVENVTLTLIDYHLAPHTGKPEPGFALLYTSKDPCIRNPESRIPYFFPLDRLKEFIGVSLSKEEWNNIYNINRDVKFTLKATGGLPTIFISDADTKEADGAYSSWQSAFDNILMYTNRHFLAY